MNIYNTFYTLIFYMENSEIFSFREFQLINFYLSILI